MVDTILNDTRRPQLKLIGIGNSNWDYFLNTHEEKVKLFPAWNKSPFKLEIRNGIYCVPKNCKSARGCKSSWYGDLNYFKKHYLKNKDCSLTELGEKIIYEGIVPMD